MNESPRKIQVLFSAKVEVIVQRVCFIVCERLLWRLLIRIDVVQLFVQTVVALVEFLKQVLEQNHFFQVLFLNAVCKRQYASRDRQESFAIHLFESQKKHRDDEDDNRDERVIFEEEMFDTVVPVVKPHGGHVYGPLTSVQARSWYLRTSKPNFQEMRPPDCLAQRFVDEALQFSLPLNVLAPSAFIRFRRDKVALKNPSVGWSSVPALARCAPFLV